MSETDTTQNTPDTGKTGTETESTQQNPPEKTFTQSQVDKKLGAVRKEGRAAVLKELGIDPTDTETIEKVKKSIHDLKPDAQKLAEQQIQQQEAVKQAEHRAFLAECKAELLTAGAQKEYLEDAMALIAVKKQDGMDITAEIESLKEKYKIWFESSDDGDTEQNSGTRHPIKTGQGTGNPLKPGQGSKKEPPEDLGKSLAKIKKQQQVKPTYW